MINSHLFSERCYLLPISQQVAEMRLIELALAVEKPLL